MRLIGVSMLVAMMLLLRFGLLNPMLRMVSESVGIELSSQISIFWFILLMASMVLIAIGGYVLNEDQKSIVNDGVGATKGDVEITSSHLMLWYQITTGLGVALAFVVAYYLGNYNYGILQLTGAISIWYYSNYERRNPIRGVLVTAFVVSLIPLIIGIYEVSIIQIVYFKTVTTYIDFNFNFLAYWFLTYSLFVFLFAFTGMLMREVEYLNTNHIHGQSVLPAKITTTVGMLLAAMGLIYVQTNYLVDQISGVFIYSILLIMAISGVTFWMQRKILFIPSIWLRITYILGVVYLLFLGYIIDHKLFL